MAIDYTNPLTVSLPYHFNTQDDLPTEVLAHRFQAWRYIIKDLTSYMKEYASVQEEVVRQQMRLQQAVGSAPGASGAIVGHRESVLHGHKDDIASLNRFFLPIGNGSIQDLPTILNKFHQQTLNNCSRTLRELNQDIIPKLEELRKDLLVKIKEIKNLQNDFKNNIGKELQETKLILSQYNQAVEMSKKSEHFMALSDADQAKHDPYLLKIKLERQLKKQLSEEGYLHDAYENLQTAGGKLEAIIVQEVQGHISTFLNLITREHASIPEFLVPNLKNGFLAKEPEFEWNSFISRNVPGSGSHNRTASFIDLSFPPRKVSDLFINEFHSPINTAIKEGPLERRSKFLKSYSSGWYVLSCNFLHEFKSSDRKRDLQPVMSLPLDYCQVSEHSKNDGKPGGFYKFVLYSKVQNGIIHRSHNWVFRANTYQDMIEWYNDIKALTTAGSTSARMKIVEQKLKIKNKNKPEISRVSTIQSSGRNIRSVKSATSNTTNGLDVSKSRTTSLATSEEPNNRLSSTFSQKNNRIGINNMVNSDGTIVTAAEPNQNGKLSPQLSHQNVNSVTATPQQFVSQNNLQPGYFYATPGSGQQMQQFYDPVKQQYFTLGTPLQPQGSNQPQYFAGSPRLPSSQPFIITQPPPNRPGSPGSVNAPQAFYPVTIYPQQLPQAFYENGELPYPSNLQAPNGDTPEAASNSDVQTDVEGIPVQMVNSDDLDVNINSKNEANEDASLENNISKEESANSKADTDNQRGHESAKDSTVDAEKEKSKE